MYFVYLLAGKPYGTLYIGWTTDLGRRVWEHKTKLVSGFMTKYGVDRLVWFENHATGKRPCAGKNRSRAGDGIGRSI
jgi:predicted GIY-YIG superfamily endonuclease